MSVLDDPDCETCLERFAIVRRASVENDAKQRIDRELQARSHSQKEFVIGQRVYYSCRGRDGENPHNHGKW